MARRSRRPVRRGRLRRPAAEARDDAEQPAGSSRPLPLRLPPAAAPPAPSLKSCERRTGAAERRMATCYASPSVRRLARELGVDLHGVAGSGRKGRLTPDDVRSAAGGGARPPQAACRRTAAWPGSDLAPWPVVDFEKFGPVERVERTRIQKISAPNLARNWVMIPHVTHNDEADITELEALAQAAQRRAGQGRRQVHDGLVPRRRVGGDAQGVPDLQLVTRRRAARAAQVLQHRIRRRHARTASSCP